MTITLKTDWGGGTRLLAVQMERVLRAVAIDAPRAHGFADVLSALKGITLTPRQVSSYLRQLSDYGWVENAGGHGHTGRWRVRADALHALAPRGALPLRPGDSPATTPRKAEPTPAPPRDLVPPARRNWREQPAWQPPAWHSARPGADDFLAVPSRSVFADREGAR
ncbi:MAG: hypothetical protein EPN34_03130 [Burkholderiaceae bacterium]|nr:MAG: hypothetical protein EPN34_03130 [Burkholderiaceae bacterium]